MKLTNILKTVKTEYKQKLNEDLFSNDNKITKLEKEIIDAVVSFFKDLWNFNPKITIKKKDGNLTGDIILNDNSLNNNKFTLHFHPEASLKYMIKYLIHELTHIKQVSKKELTVSDDWKSLIWKNDYSLSVKDYTKLRQNVSLYKNVPWEKEAFDNQDDTNLQSKLFNSIYWKKLISNNPTLEIN